MKKILLLLTLIAFVGCNTEDGPKDNTPVSTNFGGTMVVTSNKTPGAEPFTATNVHFELSGEVSALTLTMHDIRFAAAMPMSLTIAIPMLTGKTTDEKTVITSTVDPIVPYIGGKPYAQFQILDFTCIYASGKLNVSFTCRNPKIPVGNESLDHKAVFTGNILL